MSASTEVLIVGAGPAGLMLSLLLARAKIPSLVLEKMPNPTEDMRAVFYNAASQFEFKRAGIHDDVFQRGFQVRSAAFRDKHGKRLFTMPGAGQIGLIQKDLASIVQEHLSKDDHQGSSKILWNCAVTAVGQDSASAWVDADTPDGPQRLTAKYVVGCDGGASAVRRALFGQDALRGFTWEKPLVAVDLEYNLHAALPDADDSNLLIDAEDAVLIFRSHKNEPNFWRVIYRDEANLTEDEYIRRSADRLKQLVPGHPSKDAHKVLYIRPYQIHQRLVDKMRSGRVLLAGDAAHLCAPTGALGLNSAIADVGSLFDCLEAIYEGKADESILDVYSDVRREKFQSVVDTQSQSMMKLIFSDPSDVVPDHPAYKFSQLFAANPKLAAEKMPDPLILRADFSSHFRKDE